MNAEDPSERWQNLVDRSHLQLQMAEHYEDCTGAYLSFARDAQEMADDWREFGNSTRIKAEEKRQTLAHFRAEAAECKDEAIAIRKRLSGLVTSELGLELKSFDTEEEAGKLEAMADEYETMAGEVESMLKDNERDIEKCERKVREFEGNAAEQNAKAEQFKEKTRKSYESYENNWATGM